MSSKPKNVKIVVKEKVKRPQHSKPKHKKHKNNVSFSSVGSTLGGLAGKAIGKIFGGGDYKVQGNTLMSNQAPSFASNTFGTRFTHREYFADQLTTTGFTNSTYYINPGNATLFPWLSIMSQGFETYEFHGLVITYVTTSGQVVEGSGSLGSVIATTEYDCLKPAFTNKAAAEAYEFTTTTVPYKNMIHPVECKRSLQPLANRYITTRIVPSDLTPDDDPRMHYQGLLQLMAQGQPANNNHCGEWWVSYDVSLYMPRPQADIVSNVDVLAQRITWGNNATPQNWPSHSFATDNPENITFTWGKNPYNAYGVIATCKVAGYYEMSFGSINTAAKLTYSQSWYFAGCTPHFAFPDMDQDTFDGSWPGSGGQCITVVTGDFNSTRVRVSLKPGNIVYCPITANSADTSNGVIEVRAVRLATTYPKYQAPLASLRVYSMDSQGFLDDPDKGEITITDYEQISKQVKDKIKSTHDSDTAAGAAASRPSPLPLRRS